ncbi:MAG: hypothetical protein GEU90_20395 [Gemmatimonas sp.]|nr:hypothetical protein [Gemmatimonas sp.]
MNDEVAGHVRYEREGRIAHIVLDRPNKLNAFNDAQAIGLRNALDEFDGDEEADVAIVSGMGRAFSSGADVAERHMRSQEELRRLGSPEGRGASGHGLLYKQVSWKPIVGAVHGYALGLGLALALECDLTVVARDAKLQVTEIPRGLWGTRFVALMHQRGAGVFADEVILTGRIFSGEEAVDRGIFARLADPGEHLTEAVRLAEEIAANPPLAVRAAVRARRWYMQKYEQDDPLIRAAFPLHLTKEFQQRAEAFIDRKNRPSATEA